jgi:hypothetical protein
MAASRTSLNRQYCIEQAAICLISADTQIALTQSAELAERAKAWVRLGELIGDDQYTLVVH